MTDEDDIPDRLLARLLPGLPAGAIVDAAFLEVARSFSEEARAAPVTVDEIAALAYLSRGLTVQQTADALAVNVATLRSHLKLIRYKLRAKNMRHACCEALRQGLIQ